MWIFSVQKSVECGGKEIKQIHIQALGVKENKMLLWAKNGYAKMYV